MSRTREAGKPSGDAGIPRALTVGGCQCVEATDPESGWNIPLASSWVIGEKTKTVAKLVPNEAHKRYHIEIHPGVSEEEMRAAKANGTVKDSVLVPPNKVKIATKSSMDSVATWYYS